MVAGEYKTNRELFNKNAKEWTKKYANEDAQKKEKIEKITEMGFTEEIAIEALEKCGWDENEAIESLF